MQSDARGPPNISASQTRRLHWPFVHLLGWPKTYLAIEVQTRRTACAHDATTVCRGRKPTPGVLQTCPHLNHAACTGHSRAYLGGDRSIWKWKFKPRVRLASTTRPPGVVRGNRCQGSPQRFCISNAPLALAICARTWVAIEVSGHRSPKHACSVRPRRDLLVWLVQTDPKDLRNISASQAIRVHWPFVRVLGLP